MMTRKGHTRGFVERFDGEWAILLQPDFTRIRLNRFNLPTETRVGCFLEETDQPGVFTINEDITEKRQKEIRWMSESCCN